MYFLYKQYHWYSNRGIEMPQINRTVEGQVFKTVKQKKKKKKKGNFVFKHTLIPLDKWIIITSPRLQSSDVLLFCFFFTIIILPHIFVCSISRRYHYQTWWNLVGISYAMWSCAFKGWFFQNGCRCHGNGQNAKKLKYKNDHSRLIAKQKLMKLDRNNIHI